MPGFVVWVVMVTSVFGMLCANNVRVVGKSFRNGFGFKAYLLTEGFYFDFKVNRNLIGSELKCLLVPIEGSLVKQGRAMQGCVNYFRVRRFLQSLSKK